MGISSHFLAYPQESVAYVLIKGNAPSKNKRFYLSITSLFLLKFSRKGLCSLSDLPRKAAKKDN